MAHNETDVAKKQSEILLKFIEKFRPVIPSAQTIKELVEPIEKKIKDVIKPDKKD